MLLYQNNSFPYDACTTQHILEDVYKLPWTGMSSKPVPLLYMVRDGKHLTCSFDTPTIIAVLCQKVSEV